MTIITTIATRMTTWSMTVCTHTYVVCTCMQSVWDGSEQS